MEVAVKSYNETIVRDEEMKKDIVREIELCSKLRMDNIV